MTKSPFLRFCPIFGPILAKKRQRNSSPEQDEANPRTHPSFCCPSMKIYFHANEHAEKNEEARNWKATE